jgi:nitroreductase
MQLSPTDHPIHELLSYRWSPRAFSKRPIEKETLQSLFEAARWAPSSYNEQPWVFIIATKDQPDEYQRLLGCLIEFNQSWAKEAPLLILTVASLNFARNQKPNRHAFHDVGLAAANLTFEATTHGLAVHQMAGIEVEKARQEYGIPSDWEPVTAIAVGYPGDPNDLSPELRERELAPRTRKPLASFLFTGSWGKASQLV